MKIKSESAEVLLFGSEDMISSEAVYSFISLTHNSANPPLTNLAVRFHTTQACLSVQLGLNV